MGTKNFALEEFACQCPCRSNHTKLDLLYSLQHVRDIFEEAMVISSGYRCAKHNKEEGGSEDSSHIKGLAADIVIPTPTYAFALMRAIMVTNRFNRVGFGKLPSGTLVLHLDIDKDKVQDVLWGY